MPKVRVRERERDVEVADTYEMVLYQRKKFIEQQMTGKVVIHEKDREWEPSRQGRLKYYLQPHTYSDAALRDMARKRPSTLERFLEVKGVGQTKCQQYGRAMIEKIRAYGLDHGLEMDR